MADIADVLKKLDQQDNRLERIETTIATIATQSVQISNLQIQMDALWKKYDDTFSMSGPVSAIQQHQASCPRKEFPRMWGAITGLVTVDIAIVGWIIKMGITP